MHRTGAKHPTVARSKSLYPFRQVYHCYHGQWYIKTRPQSLNNGHDRSASFICRCGNYNLLRLQTLQKLWTGGLGKSIPRRCTARGTPESDMAQASTVASVALLLRTPQFCVLSSELQSRSDVSLPSQSTEASPTGSLAART